MKVEAHGGLHSQKVWQVWEALLVGWWVWATATELQHAERAYGRFQAPGSSWRRHQGNPSPRSRVGDL